MGSGASKGSNDEAYLKYIEKLNSNEDLTVKNNAGPAAVEAGGGQPYAVESPPRGQGGGHHQQQLEVQESVGGQNTGHSTAFGDVPRAGQGVPPHHSIVETEPYQIPTESPPTAYAPLGATGQQTGFVGATKTRDLVFGALTEVTAGGSQCPNQLVG